MWLGTLEVERARRALEAFCVRRNRVQNSGLACRRDGNDLVVLERSGAAAGGVRELVRLSYREGAWRVYWPRGNGVWEPYAPLPLSEKIERVVDELEQAPLHVHWG
jgi:hypothetical protein